MQHPIIHLTPYDNFEVASREVLAYLHQRLGFALWMVTRTEGADWIILQAEDHGYNVPEGTVLHWADSFCSRMVEGLGPHIAPHAQLIPAYAQAPIGQQLPIGAYIGVPLSNADGSLFGTLCAIDPNPQNESIRDDLPMITLLAKLLDTVLMADLNAVEQARLLARTQQMALTDGLTGLLNRHGWYQSMAAEEARARRYGSSACILIVDLDKLKAINDLEGHAQGDAHICSTAQSLRSAVRENDVVARIGGDEFAILGIECDAAGSEVLLRNVTTALTSKNIQASVGKAMRHPQLGLVEAMIEADREMYAIKALHRQSTPSKNI